MILCFSALKAFKSLKTLKAFKAEDGGQPHAWREGKSPRFSYAVCSHYSGDSFYEDSISRTRLAWSRSCWILF